jgi:cell wall-associated NlpC family hydrolase
VEHHSVVLGGVESVVEPVHAQGVDIVAVDGQPVGPGNVAARDLLTEIAALDPGVRPSEIGSPWPIQSPGFFTDGVHQDRVHLGFVSAGEFVPGAGVPGAGVGVPGVPGVAGVPGVGPVAAGPAAAGVAAAADQALNAPPPAPVLPAAQPVPIAQPAAGVQDLVGQQPGAGVAPALAGSNPKVSAMVTMADSLLGKPYVWGGGHAGFVTNETSLSGFDCSGFVSAVLHAGGYLNQPVTTVDLPNQPGILSGPGQLVTIFDRSGAADGHVIIDINGQFYESGGSKGPWGGGGGVAKIGRPSDSYLASFDRILHPSGL